MLLWLLLFKTFLVHGFSWFPLYRSTDLTHVHRLFKVETQKRFFVSGMENVCYSLAGFKLLTYLLRLINIRISFLGERIFNLALVKCVLDTMEVSALSNIFCAIAL